MPFPTVWNTPNLGLIALAKPASTAREVRLSPMVGIGIGDIFVGQDGRLWRHIRTLGRERVIFEELIFDTTFSDVSEEAPDGR